MNTRPDSVRLFAADLCPVCGSPLPQHEAAGRPALYCTEACRKRADRLTRRWRPVVRRLARMIAGAPGEAGTGAGLVYQLWITESARARAEVAAMRLPRRREA